jgi:DNA-binding protein H-NS
VLSVAQTSQVDAFNERSLGHLFVSRREGHLNLPNAMSKTYHQIQQEIERLQREAERLKQEEVAGVIARIKEAIRVYGLSAADLGLAGGDARKRPVGKGSLASAKAIKYRDEAGNTWSGRGSRPQWLRAALAAGRSIEEFAVQRDGGRAAPRGGGRAAGKGSKTVLRSRGVRYRDDNGNSWTGMGPKPRWLKEALTAGKTLEELAA